MEKLIENGDVILNGTKTRNQAEREAFEKLERLEHIEQETGVDIVVLYNRFPNIFKELFTYLEQVRTEYGKN